MDLRHGRWERQRRASCADVERDLIRTRTVEGRSRAKARGQPMGRQKEATRRRAGRDVAGIGRQLRPQHFHDAPRHDARMKKTPPLRIEQISVLEDSRYFLNRSVEALNLQMRRLEKYNFEDENVFWDYLADSHFYIVALKRLRQALLSSKKIPQVWNELKKEFDVFDNTISDAIQMRDILEHIDEYIKDAGKNQSIKKFNVIWHLL
jgi:hypothetical protein